MLFSLWLHDASCRLRQLAQIKKLLKLKCNYLGRFSIKSFKNLTRVSGVLKLSKVAITYTFRGSQRPPSSVFYRFYGLEKFVLLISLLLLNGFEKFFLEHSRTIITDICPRKFFWNSDFYKKTCFKFSQKSTELFGVFFFLKGPWRRGLGHFRRQNRKKRPFSP